MEEEIWKDIPGYEGYYQVSNFGRVKSLPRKLSNNRLVIKETFLIPQPNGDGYLRVGLRKRNIPIMFFVSRLVANAFLINKYKLNKIYYKDGDKTNNRFDNLQFGYEDIDQFIGKKFGKLTVISFEKIIVGGSGKYKYIQFKCKCDCGGERITSSKSLNGGGVNSCGCLLSEPKGRRLPMGASPLHTVYSSYKTGARLRKLDFNLSKERFKIIISKNCYYCNCSPSKISRNRHYPDTDYIKYNGIDRINNKLGYVIENSVPCCTDCNYAKQELSETEFLNKIVSIYKNKVTELFVPHEIYEEMLEYEKTHNSNSK